MTVLASGVFYGVDLLTQCACQTVHNNQPFLVSFLIGNNWFILNFNQMFVFNFN